MEAVLQKFSDLEREIQLLKSHIFHTANGKFTGQIDFTNVPTVQGIPIGGSPNPSYISCYGNPGTPIASYGSLLVAFNTTSATNSTIAHSASVNCLNGFFDTFTPSISGDYLISWAISIQLNNSALVNLSFYINDVNVAQSFQNLYSSATTRETLSGNQIITLTSEQTFSIKITSDLSTLFNDSNIITFLKVN